jgi:hypothetical protein
MVTHQKWKSCFPQHETKRGNLVRSLCQHPPVCLLGIAVLCTERVKKKSCVIYHYYYFFLKPISLSFRHAIAVLRIGRVKTKSCLIYYMYDY